MMVIGKTHDALNCVLLDPVALLSFAGSLRVAADNLDAVGMNLLVVVQLEVDVLDDEGPDIVAESVGIEMSLQRSALGGVEGDAESVP